MILGKIRSCMLKLVVGFRSYASIRLLGPSGPDVVSRPQTPNWQILLRFHNFIIKQLMILDKTRSFMLTLFRMGGKNVPLPVFFPVTSTNVGIRLPNFLTFSFNPLPHWCKASSLYLVPVPNYWTWTKSIPQKHWFFWSNPSKIEVMITCSHRNSRVKKPWSHDYIYNIIWVTW